MGVRRGRRPARAAPPPRIGRLRCRWPNLPLSTPVLTTRATVLVAPVRVDRPRPARSRVPRTTRDPTGATNTNRSLYLPEPLKPHLDENGVIHGKYRAQFQIARCVRSIPMWTSRFRSFRHERLRGSNGNVPWIGAAGREGQLTLKLVSENSLESRLDRDPSSHTATSTLGTAV